MTAPIERSSPSNVVDQNTIILDSLFSDYNKQISNVSYESLMSTVHKIIMMQMHLSYKMGIDYMQHQTIEVTLYAKKVKGTYNTWLSVSFTATSSILQGGGGAVSIFGAFTTAVGDSLTKFSNLSSGLTGIGGGVGTLNGIVTQKNEAIRFVFQVDLEELKRKRDDRMQSTQKNDQQKTDAISKVHELMRMRAEMFRSTASSSGG